MRKVVALFAVLVFVLSFGMGCSTYSKTVRTETVQYPPETVQGPTHVDERPKEPLVVEKRKEETTTETKDESVGLLSGTVHVVGQALALPFRLVGGLIGVIF